MVQTNDENAIPEAAPNECNQAASDLIKRQTRTRSLSRASLCEPPRSAAPSAAGLEGPEAEAEKAMDLQRLLFEAMGDPDASLQLLRAKPVASKYDFKARISELSEHNRALRSALAEHRERHRMLGDALAFAEADINLRLRAAASEAMVARKQLDEQLVVRLQDTLRSVWREAATEDVLGPTQSASAVQRQVFEEQLEGLRQCCAAESSRAAKAEALARKTQDSLLAVEQELLEVRRAAQAQAKGLERNCQHARGLVEEAGVLLRSQVEESNQHCAAIVEAAGQREGTLRSELATAVDRARKLEERLAALEAARQGSTATGDVGQNLP
mmetsp:Transcript_15352/g.33733  ORF Transcript_15352/g.33733 Transcript_15352/m.33733 type:complete len:328 (+) Transcript_15352:111-1094(+)